MACRHCTETLKCMNDWRRATPVENLPAAGIQERADVFFPQSARNSACLTLERLNYSGAARCVVLDCGLAVPAPGSLRPVRSGAG